MHTKQERDETGNGELQVSEIKNSFVQISLENFKHKELFKSLLVRLHVE